MTIYKPLVCVCYSHCRNLLIQALRSVIGILPAMFPKSLNQLSLTLISSSVAMGKGGAMLNSLCGDMVTFLA